MPEHAWLSDRDDGYRIYEKSVSSRDCELRTFRSAGPAPRPRPAHDVSTAQARIDAVNAADGVQDHPNPRGALQDHQVAGRRNGLSSERLLSKREKQALQKQLWEDETEDNDADRGTEETPRDHGLHDH